MHQLLVMAAEAVFEGLKKLASAGFAYALVPASAVAPEEYPKMLYWKDGSHHTVEDSQAELAFLKAGWQPVPIPESELDRSAIPPAVETTT